jgi:DNA-binding transcriptional LysR family regulator
MLQDSLRRHGIERRILLELPGFLGLASILSTTDLVATVPRTIGETVAKTGAIRVVPCPVKVPAFPVSQYWHARYHHDPGGRWLRSTCATLLTPPGGPRSFPA